MNLPSSENRVKEAKILSLVFNPVLLTVVGLAIITYRYADSSRQFLVWTLTGSALIIGPALLFALFYSLQQRRLDLDISRREDRIIPLMLASLGAFTGSYLVNTRVEIINLEVLSSVLVAVLISLTIVTFVWKISLHTAALTGIVTLLVVFRGPIFTLAYLTIIPVAWSRLTLKQHTPAQLTGGAIVGAGITYLATVIFRG